MLSDPKLIQALNQVLFNELTAAHQYFLHRHLFKHWGFHKLADQEQIEYLDELNHANAVTERILMLEGEPNLQQIGKLLIGKNVSEIFALDLKLNHIALPVLHDTIAYAEKIKDYVTRDLLSTILAAEETHISWIETQLNLMQTLGEKEYLAEHM